MLHNQSLKCTIGIWAGGLQPPDSGKAIIFRANAIFFGQKKHEIHSVQQDEVPEIRFYRPMHSAKRGTVLRLGLQCRPLADAVAYACALTVCLSVTLVDQDHIG